MSRAQTARERHLAQSLPGRGSGSRRPALSSVIFRPATLICLVLIGIFAFGAQIVLNGFANDFQKAPPGQATPRSVSAVGYKAVSAYLDKLGYDIRETRGKRKFLDREARLVVYTPARPTRRLSRILEAEGEAINLVILPKWSVRQIRKRRGEDVKTSWVRKTSRKGLVYVGFYESLMDDLPVIRRRDAPSPDTKLSFETPRDRNLPKGYQPDFKNLQYFDLKTRWPEYQNELSEVRRLQREKALRKAAEEKGETYEPKKKKDNKKVKAKNTEKTDPKPLPKHKTLLEIDDRPVLIQLEDTQTYILSEPDLINTMAFNSQGGAQLTHIILNDIIYEASAKAMTVDFDVSLHGIESNRNIIKLMVTPPFLAATLCLLAAGGLVGWQGFNRFGDPARMRPDYAQGPVSLARTAAEFMGVANRAHKTGENYARLIRRQVTAELGYKTRTSDDIDILLDAREKRLNIQPVFADLERSIAGADSLSYGQYAQALTTWREAMTQSDFPQEPQDS